MLAEAFARAKAEGRAALIPYVMAGDPDPGTSLDILRAIALAGADAVELGIPYGDPLADGPTIAAAGQRALKHGVQISTVLELVRQFRAGSAIPVVLFTYFNPVYQYGLERFAADAAAAGASGAIVPDVALEESAGMRDAFRAAGLDMPLLVAPSTPAERAQRIAAQSTGFVYVVSRLGVTGANTGSRAFDSLQAQVSMLRGATALPLAVGFGVSNANDVRSLASFADAAIVGSALIDSFANEAPAQAASAAASFVASLRTQVR